MNISPKREPMPFQKALTINACCKMLTMPKIMQDSFRNLGNFIASKNIQTTEVPFSRYHGFNWEKITKEGFFKTLWGIFTRVWQFETGIPITSEEEGFENIEYTEYTYTEVISCIHTGPYHKIGPTYKELYKWIKEQNINIDDIAFELYLNDPRVTKPEELQTKILVPIA